MGLLLERGQRGLLVGRTGSGKSQNAIFQLRNTKVWPVLMLDTKIEPAFFGVPQDGDSFELIENIVDFEKYMKEPARKRADYTLVRPSRNEMREFELLDQYFDVIYNTRGQVLTYVDELYNWHNNNRIGPAFGDILTRGRSKGKTTLMATQRPAWISRFCLTESDKFYLHQLNDARDRKTLSEVVPDFDRKSSPPKYHFWHYEVGEHDSPVLFKPVPIQDTGQVKFSKTKWI